MYGLDIYEAKLILSALKKITYSSLPYNEVINEYIRVEDNSKYFTKAKLKNISNRYYLINKNSYSFQRECMVKYTWLDDINIKNNYILLKFNKDVIQLFNKSFISFIKTLDISSIKHVSALNLLKKINSLNNNNNNNNNNKFFIDFNDIKLLDNNNLIYLNNFKQERLNITQEKSVGYNIVKLNTINQFICELEKEKSIEYYIKLLNLLKNDLMNYNKIELRYKLGFKRIDGKTKFGFKFKYTNLKNIKTIKHFDSLKSSYKKEFKDVIENLYIDSKNNIFNEIQKIRA